jgi:CheY-like chemotaxis protein
MIPYVLLFEDCLGDACLSGGALREVGTPIQLHVACDGVKAMAPPRKEGSDADVPRPDLIPLDLNLPRIREVRGQIKEDDGLKSVPTIILIASESEADIVKSYELQAN